MYVIHIIKCLLIICLWVVSLKVCPVKGKIGIKMSMIKEVSKKINVFLFCEFVLSWGVGVVFRKTVDQ